MSALYHRDRDLTWSGLHTIALIERKSPHSSMPSASFLVAITQLTNILAQRHHSRSPRGLNHILTVTSFNPNSNEYSASVALNSTEELGDDDVAKAVHTVMTPVAGKSRDDALPNLLQRLEVWMSQAQEEKYENWG
jgi:hypothetical protein